MVIQSQEEIIEVFDGFRKELDESNDRRERIIKLSREITMQSKRIIFLLHRLATEKSPANVDSDGPSSYMKAAQAAQGKLRHIKDNLFTQLLAEVPTDDIYWQHQKSITPGVQEYIEAVSYAHYLSTEKLITHAEMIGWLIKDEIKASALLPHGDFLLGLSDLTGELMRLAITAVARGGGRAKADSLSAFVRKCRADFERFTPFVRELSKKQRVTRQSVQKIEQANYAVKLRCAEFGSEPDELDDLIQRSMISYSDYRPDYREGRDFAENDERDEY